VALGRALGLSDEKIGQLRTASLLHDIGKIGISDSIIRKPGPLDGEEMGIMRKHCELGATIVSHMPELAYCAPAIRHHHEWYDGSGYPSGLKGEDIPLEARIIAIADAYDTMTTPRSYRQRASPQEALDAFKRSANTQFDPLHVEIFPQLVDPGTGDAS
jgi:HD-GYP domain-containing protein (c-di-GMP phosphodiesterase class II)